MHFKGIIVISALLFSSVSCADDSWSGFLAKDMARKYELLNERVDYCKNQRKLFNYDNPINSEWFNSLSLPQRQKVILFSFDYASSQCSSKERGEYTESMLRYVSISGDETPYKEWKLLSVRSADEIADVNSLGAKQLVDFSKTYFNAPFDGLKMLKVLNLY
ncbi:hypothetical protein [Shewanella algae]|uniref:hypothetical protein n=1 Tax=Shewanella algae TaxID=38313 RepID=UPI001F1E43AF|nr:hypothetical protein [Shewanella algae]MCE9785861.1 hypothetical protein [Shewanella algae]